VDVSADNDIDDWSLAMAMTTRRYENLFTATTDNISVNELGVAPGPGAVGVWAASDVNDGLLTVRIGGHIQVNRQVIRNSGTNAPILTEEEAPVAQAQVQGGERITVDYVEVSAANARVIVAWAGFDAGLG